MRKVVVLLLLLACGSHQQCLTADDNSTTTTLSSTKEPLSLSLSQGEKVLSVEVLKALADSSPGNVIFSPLSLQQVLLLAYFGSRNGTEKLLKYFLRIPPEQSKTITLEAYRSSNDLFKKTDAYTLNSANRIYVSDKVEVRPCMSEMFAGNLEKVDLASDILAAQRKINSWVETKTEGQIKNFLSQLSPASTMVLVNAAYFKGKWVYTFPQSATNRANFFVNPQKKVKVDMMKQLGPFNYMFSFDLEAHVLELPYKGEEVSMFLILPRDHKAKDVDDVIRKLDANVLAEITDPAKIVAPDSDISLHLPKFAVESKIPMEEILKTVGAGDILNSSADFSGFTGKNEVSFNGLKHQARLEVDEEGTKAAAASAAGVFLSAGATPSFFICNRPFTFFIYHKKTGNVLFMGVYRSPENGS